MHQPTPAEIKQHRTEIKTLTRQLKAARSQGDARAVARLVSRLRVDRWALAVVQAPRIGARERQAFAREFCSIMARNMTALSEAGA